MFRDLAAGEGSQEPRQDETENNPVRMPKHGQADQGDECEEKADA